MLASIYYSLAIAAYSIFLIQFCISFFGGSDIDTDIDFDGDGFGDVNWSDIFSFKGIIHFLMGFAGWLSLMEYTSYIAWYDYAIALGLGVAFVVILLFVGRALLKLKYEPTGQTAQDFVGHKAVITIIDSEDESYYASVPDFNGQEIKVFSTLKYDLNIGDEVTIASYEDGKYFI